MIRLALVLALPALGSWAGHSTTQSLGLFLCPIPAGPVGSRLKAWSVALP